MTESTTAHTILTPILASLAISWRLKGKEEGEAAQKVASGEGERKTWRADGKSAGAHEGRARDLMAMAGAASKGILMITRAEANGVDHVPFLTPEIVEMARLTGRLQLSD